MIDPLESRRLFATTGLDPTYGNAGVASTVVAQAGSQPALFTDVIASGFAASGAGYVLARQENTAPAGVEEDYYDRYLLYRVSADGKFDSSFGTNGRFELKTPGDIIGFQTLAVSQTGRLVVTDSKGAYHLFDADGHEQYGASNRLTRTIRRLAGLSYATGKRTVFSETAAFDAEGRLLIPGQIEKKGNAIAVFRFTTYGELDHTFGNVGRAFTRLANEAINYSPTELAVGRDGQIALTMIADADTSLGKQPDGSTILTSSIDEALISPDGTLISRGRLLSAAEPGNDDTGGSSGNFDLRALADGTFAAVGHAASNGAVSILKLDSTVSSKVLPKELDPPAGLTPAGTLRGWVGSADAPYSALEGLTDRFGVPHTGSVNQFTILGDGSLIAAGYDAAATVPTLIVQKFDGTGVTTPAASATARFDPATRTLDVRGTARADTITIRVEGGRVRVRINGTVQTFAAAGIDTLHVSANGGDDTVSVNVGRQNLAVRVRGGSGNDRVETDAYRATIDGGDGNDTGTLTPGSDLNPVGIEALRHPGRRR